MTITTPPSFPLFRYIYNCANKYNLLWQQVTTGLPRVGKTRCNIVMAEHCDPRFNVTKIVFTPKEFMDVIDDMKRGNAVVFSELGIAHSSRKWHSFSNLLTNEVLQTFVYQHPIVFFDVPDFSYIDSQARKIMNAFAEVQRRSNTPPRMWFNMLSWDRKRGKEYFPHPILMMDKQIVKMRSILFKKQPSPKLLKEFIRKEEDYKQSVRKKNRATLKAVEMEEVNRTRSVQDDMIYVKEHIEDFKNKRGKLDAQLIQADLGLSQFKSTQVKKLVEKEEAI